MRHCVYCSKNNRHIARLTATTEVNKLIIIIDTYTPVESHTYTTRRIAAMRHIEK